VLGLTAERRIRVSDLYVARSEAGRGVVLLAGRSLIAPMPGQPVVELDHIGWHGRQVFKGTAADSYCGPTAERRSIRTIT
jgi:putative restriction endonuclease